MNISLASAHLEQINTSTESILSLASQIMGSAIEPEIRMTASKIKYHCRHIHDDVDLSRALFTGFVLGIRARVSVLGFGHLLR